MTICRAKDYADMSRKAANIISAQIIMKPACVLGLATGSSPEGTYKQLIEWYEKGDLDFSQVTTINLDEYCGLPPEHKQSYRYFMDHHLFDKVNIDKRRTFVPDGLAEPEEGCKKYEEIIRSVGGIDLQLLGIGQNGHIGFNEPNVFFESETHCVDLAEDTIEANCRFFVARELVPKQAYTVGLRTIMQAKRILVIASGKNKAQAVYNAIYGRITPQVPASILQLHNDVIFIADEDACSLLPEDKPPQPKRHIW